jgi:HEAT repeats
MKKILPYALIILLAALGVGFWLWPSQPKLPAAPPALGMIAVAPPINPVVKPTDTSGEPTSAPRPAASPYTLVTVETPFGPRKVVQVDASQPMPQVFPHEQTRDAIQALVVSYDPAKVPEIAAFLGHADETVRAAARNGLVQLGHPSAVPFLRERLSRAPNAEKAEILEIITFLEMPAQAIVPLTPETEP